MTVLFAHLILQQLPAAVRTGLTNFPFLAVKSYRSLPEEADRILLATRTFDVHALVPDSLVAPPTHPRPPLKCLNFR